MPTLADTAPITAVTSLVAVVTGGGANTMQPMTIPTPLSSFVSSPTDTPTTSSATASLILITALPPATSPGRDRPPPPKSFDIVYLTPLFAVLGVAVGVICAWLFLRWHSRKHGVGRYSDALQPGPEFFMPPSRPASVRSYLPPTGISRGDARPPGRTSLSFMTHEGRPNDEQAGSWFKRMLSSRRGGPQDNMPVRANTGRSLARTIDGDDFHITSDIDEYDPFLEVPAASRGTTAGSSTLATTDMARSRSMLTTSFISPGSLGGEDDWAEVPYDTLRHNSIRRGILDRLKNGSLYRPGHKRQDSDLHVEDVRVSSEGVYSPVAMHESPTRCRSQRSDYSTVPRSMIEERSVPGFRIVEEDPEAVSSMRGSIHGGWNWTLPWSSGNKVSLEDRLTPLPSRRSLVGKSKSRSPSPTKSRPSASEAISRNAELARPTGAPRIDSSVLPSSPALLMSPPLQEKLFFGPVSSSIPTSAHKLRSDGKRSSQDTSGVDRETRKTNKLHTKKTPPLLPFPSSNSDSPYRSRLTKGPVRAKGVTSILSSDSVSATDDAQQADALDGRHASRHGALNKVDEIMARGWSERELRGDEITRSPTMFGALAVPEHSPLAQQWNQELDAMSGIDERLAKSRI
ncbi:hypothetical protein QCA50_014982 [Cerrena zonata]|uniref:Uncharacterized protein n=1 Tax=Cerrena zonata TaxID=2478898 RepID=A0AAW0FLK8_9APHY